LNHIQTSSIEKVKDW